MAPSLLGAVATDGEARVMRERGEQIQHSPGSGLQHLGAIPLHERGPLPVRDGALGDLHRRGAGSEVR